MVAHLDAIVGRDSLDVDAFYLWSAVPQNYARCITYCTDAFPRHSGGLHAIFFEGCVLPYRTVAAFQNRAPSACPSTTTLAETFQAVRDTGGDAGDVMRALLGVVRWKNASRVGRLAILFRLAIEHRRGFPLPVYTPEDIARNSVDDGKPVQYPTKPASTPRKRVAAATKPQPRANAAPTVALALASDSQPNAFGIARRLKLASVRRPLMRAIAPPDPAKLKGALNGRHGRDYESLRICSALGVADDIALLQPASDETSAIALALLRHPTKWESSSPRVRAAVLLRGLLDTGKSSQ